MGTIREYYRRHGQAPQDLRLVDFGPEGNFLAISPRRGRLELVDLNCAGAGPDASHMDVAQAVSDWLRCIELGGMLPIAEEDLPLTREDLPDDEA